MKISQKNSSEDSFEKSVTKPMKTFENRAVLIKHCEWVMREKVESVTQDNVIKVVKPDSNASYVRIYTLSTWKIVVWKAIPFWIWYEDDFYKHQSAIWYQVPQVVYNWVHDQEFSRILYEYINHITLDKVDRYDEWREETLYEIFSKMWIYLWKLHRKKFTNWHFYEHWNEIIWTDSDPIERFRWRFDFEKMIVLNKSIGITDQMIYEAKENIEDAYMRWQASMCHNDLSKSNIFYNQETLDIMPFDPNITLDLWAMDVWMALVRCFMSFEEHIEEQVDAALAMIRSYKTISSVSTELLLSCCLIRWLHMRNGNDAIWWHDWSEKFFRGWSLLRNKTASH